MMSLDSLKIVNLALKVLSERLLSLLALLTSFALGCWTMWGPMWERVVTLGIFVVFAYLLVYSKERSRREDHSDG
jgi:ABC-type multidrug transport system permease subunit